MGCKGSLVIIWIMVCALSWPQVEASGNLTWDALDSYVYGYAVKSISRPRTGRLYRVSLPVNLSGMEVSIIRLRTHRLWRDGDNFSSFEIPPRTLPRPFTRRVDIVYQNLGNWSASYYNVPNHTFVAPVIGCLAYDSDSSSTNRGLVELDMEGGNPIVVRFPNVSLQEDDNVRVRCVRFSTNGTLEFSNLTSKSSCLARGQGHFSLVIPYKLERGRKRGWMVGLAAGLAGLVLLVALGIVASKVFKWQRIRKMERRSERSEGLGTIWIGHSRMPSASGIRTQPILENNYVP